MTSPRLRGCLLALFAFVFSAGAFETLSADQLKMFQDAGGWEYVSLSDSDNGIQTQHTCFDGKPHPQDCSGTLSFTAQKAFTQNVHIHGQTVQRHGNYTLDADQLSFFDEFGTKDGPYTVHLDTQTKSMTLQMPSAKIELKLEKDFRAAPPDKK